MLGRALTLVESNAARHRARAEALLTRLMPSTGRALRVGLITLAVVQMLLAAPLVLFGRDAGAPIHLAREIGSFDLALAIGFFIVGWRPARAWARVKSAVTGAPSKVPLTRQVPSTAARSSVSPKVKPPFWSRPQPKFGLARNAKARAARTVRTASGQTRAQNAQLVQLAASMSATG